MTKLLKPRISTPRLIILGFALLVLTGRILLALPASSASGRSMGLVDAMFISTSAVCVTGLSVLDVPSTFSVLCGRMIAMLNMKKTMAVSVLSAALLIPGIAQARDMGAMEAKPDAMMEQSAMMEPSAMMDMKGFVPLRMFAETLGYSIMWNKDDRSITLTYMNTGMNMSVADAAMQMSSQPEMSMNAMYTITLMADSNVIMVGTDKKMLKQSPMLMHGIVYISKDVVTSYLLAPFMMKSMN